MIAPPPIYQIPFLIIRGVIPLLILFSLSPLLRAQPQTFFYRSWTQSGSTLDPNFINHVVSVVNSNRETYVASSSLNTSGTYSMRLTKYGSSGAESWNADFTVNTGGNVHVGAIALDPSENILITGSAYNGSTNNYDLFTAKYNPSGAKLWHALHNGAGNSFDGGTAIACASNSDVFVTGGAWASLVNVDMVTIGYNSSGTNLWTRTYDNASLSDAGGAVSVASSQVTATGFTQVNATTWEYITIQYSQGFGLVTASTVTSLGGTTIERANAAVIDASGNIYITGALGGSGTGLNVKTVKLDAGLNILWTASWNGASNQDDTGRGIVVDASGNVFIAGYTTAGGQRDALLLKYSSGGTLSFAQTYDGEEGADEFAGLAMSSAGEIFAAGYTTRKGNKDFYSAFYDGSGSLRWSEAYNGLLNGDDEVQYVSGDGAGSYVVSGPSTGLTSGGGSATVLSVKYARHSLVKPVDEAVNAPFIQNRGQALDTDGDPASTVRYYSHSTYPNVYLLDNSVSYVFAHIDTIPSSEDTMARIDLTFPTGYTGRPNAPTGLEEQAYHNNYYLGHIPEGRERVPLDNKVLFPSLYPYIDALFGQGQDGLFLRFTYQTGSHPADLKMDFAGETAISILGNGDLKVETALEDLILPKPEAITISGAGVEADVTAWAPAYSIGGDGKVSITTGTYDTDKTLVVKVGRDRGPDDLVELWWSTYYGWTGTDMEAAVDCDQDGFVYTCGRSFISMFPVGSTILSPMGQSDWTVNKFNLSGEPQWFVMIGGLGDPVDFEERSRDISVGNSDFLYVGGVAGSPWPSAMLPNTGGFHDDDFNVNNTERGVVTKLEKIGGTLKWGTFFGDGGLLRESILGVEALSGGGVAVVGFAQGGTGPSLWTNVDPGGNAHQSTVGDMYIGEFNTGNALTWATKFGPANDELNDSNAPTDIVEDGNGNLFVVGVIIKDATSGDEFPTGGGYAKDPSAPDGFVAKFADDRDLVWSTYLGGSGLDYCSGVAFDPTNNDIVVVRTAESTVLQGFPIVGSGNAVLDDGTLGGSSDLFLAKFANNGTLLHSRYFGGDAKDNTDRHVLGGDGIGTLHPSNGVAVDEDGNIFITGSAGDGLPVAWPNPIPLWYFPDFSGGVSDAFVAALAPNFKIEYCTYLGSSNEDHGTGIAVFNTDSPSRHSIFMVGRTRLFSNNYPTQKETALSYFNNAFLGSEFDGVISNIKTNAIIVDTKEAQIPATAVSVSPNPCSDFISIQIDGEYLGQGMVRIYDLVGRQVRQSPLSPGQSRLTINTRQLIPGAYAIGVSLPSGTWSGKFVKSTK